MAKTRVPPHSREAEVSLLGALLIDKDAVIEVAQILKPEFFYNDQHQLIYDAIATLYEARQPIDVVTVSEQLKKSNSLKKAGGRTYLTELVNQTPTSAHVKSYAGIVKDNYTKRQLISLGSRIVEQSFDDSGEAGQVLEEAEKKVFSLSQKHLSRNFIAIKDALAESFDRLDELHKSDSGLRGVPTGFYDIDNFSWPAWVGKNYFSSKYRSECSHSAQNASWLILFGNEQRRAG